MKEVNTSFLFFPPRKGRGKKEREGNDDEDLGPVKGPYKAVSFFEASSFLATP